MTLAARALAGTLLAAALGGCNVVGDVYAARLETFVPANYAWATKPGSNTLKGRALSDDSTRVPGPCRGQVVLVPDGPYVRYHTGRISEPYLDPETLSDRALDLGTGGVLGAEASYLQRFTSCDAEGRFTFTGLPDGPYLVYAALPDGQLRARKRVALYGGRMVKLDIVHTCKDFPYKKRLGGGVHVCGIAPVRLHPPPGNENLF